MAVFRVLGPIEARGSTTSLRLGGRMQQTLLAALLASQGEIVTTQSLAEELWGTTPPAKADNALQAQVSRLRRSLTRLEPERRTPRLSTSVSGYRLALDPFECDAWSFMLTVRAIEHRAQARPDDAHSDIEELRDALATWRGPVFGGLTGGLLCQTAAAKYQEARNVALDLLYGLELRTERHATIIPELTELVSRHPLHEQFSALLMVALYRSGRQIDALDVYHRLRGRLADELGVEPSPVLQRYQRGILQHSLAL